MRPLLLVVWILLGPLLLVNALQPQPLERFTFTEPHMGTTVRIVLYASDEATAKKAAKAAFARIAELNAVMSDYQPDSELMKLCKDTSGKPVSVSANLFDVLQKSLHFAELSEGALDVSISPVVRLWRRSRRTGVMPDAAELKKAVDLVDYRKVRLDAKTRTVQLLLMGMMLDLGCIGKGYAADAALAVLRQHGITRALVALGGDIAVGDPPPDAPGWKVGVAHLKNPDAPPTHHLLLKNAGVSTSGDSEQFYEFNGKRYSHIVDPKTGLGLIGRRSVTVVAPNATTSDALDTAICVMGVERGLKMLESQPGCSGLLVFEIGDRIETTPSKDFANHLVREVKKD
jgi:thiamine biosynthesis lipoprotein